MSSHSEEYGSSYIQTEVHVLRMLRALEATRMLVRSFRTAEIDDERVKMTYSCFAMFTMDLVADLTSYETSVAST